MRDPPRNGRAMAADSPSYRSRAARSGRIGKAQRRYVSLSSPICSPPSCKPRHTFLTSAFPRRSSCSGPGGFLSLFRTRCTREPTSTASGPPLGSIGPNAIVPHSRPPRCVELFPRCPALASLFLPPREPASPAAAGSPTGSKGTRPRSSPLRSRLSICECGIRA